MKKPWTLSAVQKKVPVYYSESQGHAGCEKNPPNNVTCQQDAPSWSEGAGGRELWVETEGAVGGPSGTTARGGRLAWG